MHGDSAAGRRRATVERYLEAIRRHDWDDLGRTLAPGVARIGPFGDVYEGAGTYVDFLSELLPTLERYELTITRIVEIPTGTLVELSETMLVDGSLTKTDEVLVFDLDDEARITRIAIYIQTPQTLEPDRAP